jgi:2-methylfumaryl-CoA hydratase
VSAVPKSAPASSPPPRPLEGYFFEDYRVGQHLVHPTPRTVTQGDVALYQALTGSRCVVHCAEPVARALGHPAMPVDDLLVFHIAFGKTVPDISYNAVANLGYADVRFQLPVYIGDTLRCETEIIGLKENSSGKNGNVYVRSTAFNQRGKPVLTWIRWVMVNKRDAQSQAPEKVVPVLPPEVPSDALSIPAGLKPRALQTAASGGLEFWDDYAIGQVIDHPGGMTLDESDHTLATKLYQNTARVHFDAHRMAKSPFGRRLVYGGHVMSVCRALAHDGFENVLSIAAINGGSHVNPTFAGDTLYAKTRVLGKWALRPDLGALRLRLLGIKNRAASEFQLPFEAPPADLVLDLDYTVLIPRH